MRLGLMIYPLLAQVALTFALVAALGWLRLRAALRREVRIADVALGSEAWPARVRQVGNSYGNQFEMPVLFYLLCVLTMIEGRADGWQVGLAWAFVASRYLHAAIHVTVNVVPYRFYAFAAGNAVLIAMWLRYAFALLTAPGE